MIKEYFSDGLLGLAILLSLLRTDLVSINNLIDYPEVQDVLLGQTIAYMPASFHHIHNFPHTFGNPKHLDLDSYAFTAWFNNINNLSPLPRHFEIEAFLVSAEQQGSIEGVQRISSLNLNSGFVTDDDPEISSPVSQEEGNETLLKLLNETDSSSAALPSQSNVDDDVSKEEGATTTSFSEQSLNSDLTKEDLNLIDILYQQDVDLGVGKEVFDPSIREELEKKREQEFIKQQEREKAQRLAEHKKEEEKKALQDKWLKTNFRRDGETGEWVQLEPVAGGSNSNQIFSSFLDFNESQQELITLDDALDLLGNLQDTPDESQPDTYLNSTYEPVETLPVTQPVLQHQDSLQENLSVLAEYLNINITGSVAGNIDVNETFLQLSQELPVSADEVSELGLEQPDYLRQNVTLPAADIDISMEFNDLTPLEEFDSPVALEPANHSLLDFDINDLSFFGDLTTTLPGEPSSVFDLGEVGDFFGHNPEVDSVVLLEKSFNSTEDMNSSHMLREQVDEGAVSSFPDLVESFDALEGATGGSDDHTSYRDTNDHFSKVSHLSESSNDSGFVNLGASPSSSSSYAGSPASSHNGLNGSTSNNDTENDPHGTRVVANYQVAHNHTYNTPLGQAPREVKKYAPKDPSRKGPHSRDQRRAEELKVPFTIDEIIESPVEKFNELLTKYKLSETQLTLIRDIRRRGKNKVAAQNCRKRKVSVIFNLNDEMSDLQKMRDRLVAERAAMDRERFEMKQKFSLLYTHIFQSLRDERGEPYDPSMYSLQQSSDGNVFLVPRNITITKSSNVTSPLSEDSTNSKKRKSLEQ